MRRFSLVNGLMLAVLGLCFAASAADSRDEAAGKATDAKAAASDTAIIPLPQVPTRVSELLQDRNYAEAIKAIDEAVNGQGAARDYLGYLKGRALELSCQYDAAVDQFTALDRQFPKSEWARRARFGKAVAFARKGDYRSAELIYRGEVEYLLSAARKQEIADLYLEFADAYFKPKDEVQDKRDYQKALEFYLKALEVGPRNDHRTEVELQAARCYQLLGQLPEAAKRYAQFVKDHPDSPLEIEARFRLGEDAACSESAGRCPPHVARPAGRAWQLEIGADRRRRPTSFRRPTGCRIRRATKTSISASPRSNRSSKKYPDHKLAADSLSADRPKLHRPRPL